MATTSEPAESKINASGGGDDDKNKKVQEGEQGTSSQASPTVAVQGEQKTEKVNEPHQADKSETTLTSEQQKPNPVSIPSSPDIATTNEAKPQEPTTTEHKEESGSAPVSSAAPINLSGQTEETTKPVASSVPSADTNNKKDEPTTPLAASTETKNETKTDDHTQGNASTSQQGVSDSNKDQLLVSQSSTSESKTEDDTKTKSPAPLQRTASDANETFPIEKGDAEHLTDFQRQKAKYFFNVNLDLKNNESVTWDEVEFYLLFHATAAGKEGSSDGALLDRLSRAARVFWDHVHDQVPLADKSRDKLTLDQFLDTWASLVDYILQKNQLPSIVQDLVRLGFELYTTDDKDGKPATVQPAAFEGLFQRMNLPRPFAQLAYKSLTENGTKPLDANRIDSIVKAVVASCDDENESHFLLPGFFKTISNKPNEKGNQNASPSSNAEEKESKTSEKPTSPQLQSTSRSSSPSQQQQPKTPASPTPQNPKEPSTSQQQQPKTPASPTPQKQQNSREPSPSGTQRQQSREGSSPSLSTSANQSSSNNQHEEAKSPAANLTSTQHTAGPLPPDVQKTVIQKEDDGVRRLLQYYRIDDSDIFEVAAGSIHRLVLAHPERPLPPYIQQNKGLLQILRADPVKGSSTLQNQPNAAPNQSAASPASQQTPAPAAETKPKVTLEERVSRGEAQKGPSVPLPQQAQRQESASSTGVRQVYPQLSPAQQEEQQRQAKLQATQPPQAEQQKSASSSSSTVEESSRNKDDFSKQEPSSSKREISRAEEEQIVAAVIKQLTPIVEKRVAAEVRRAHSGDTDQGDDEDFIPFPFMMGGGFPMFAGGGPPPQMFRQQQHGAGLEQPQTELTGEAEFDGMQIDGSFIPPQMLMAMMNGLQRSAAGEEFAGFPSNGPPPSRGPGGAPTGVEGFMLFGADPTVGNPAGYPQRPGPRY